MWEQKITAWDLSLVYCTASHDTEPNEGHSLAARRILGRDHSVWVYQLWAGASVQRSTGDGHGRSQLGSHALLSPARIDDRLSSESSECKPAVATGVRLTCKSSKLQMGRCRSYEKSQLEVCQAKVIEKRMGAPAQREPRPVTLQESQEGPNGSASQMAIPCHTVRAALSFGNLEAKGLIRFMSAKGGHFQCYKLPPCSLLLTTCMLFTFNLRHGGGDV